MSSTLLLADDSVTIQRVIELTFQNEDIRVIATSDGESAIQRIDADPPDIVLADVGMPKQDGYAVSAHVKNTPMLRKIPVLLLTGAFEPVDEDKARASGCDGILVKPFEPQQLIGRVKELLAGGVPATPARPFEISAKRPAPVPVPMLAVPSPPAAVPRPAAVPAPAAVVPQPRPPQLSPAPVPVAPPHQVRAPVPPAIALPAPAAKLGPAPKPVGPVPHTDPPDMEASFQREFDQLDAAFAQLDPEPAAAALDDETASDFARDLDLYRSTGDPSDPADPGDRIHPVAAASNTRAERVDRGDRAFADWDLPDLPPMDGTGSADAASAPSTLNLRGASPPPYPDEPNWGAPPTPVAPPAPATPPVQPVHLARPIEDEVIAPEVPAPAPAPGRRVSMAGAFAALLAAEQAQPGPTPSAGAGITMSETTVEEVVRRVLSRMTDDTVKRIVHDTAERLIKEEIEKIKEQ